MSQRIRWKSGCRRLGGGLPWLVVLLLMAGCESAPGPDEMTVDAGPAMPDAGARRDAGAPIRRDAGPPLPRFSRLPASCWLPPNTLCNPANNDGCEADEACDLALEPDGRPIIACFPPPVEQELGDRCNNERGPFCRGGLRCSDGMCMDTCCDDSECTLEGERCIPMNPDLGSLGVCREFTPMACQPPGGPCGGATDCCSNDCHLGHCH